MNASGGAAGRRFMDVADATLADGHAQQFHDTALRAVAGQGQVQCQLNE